MTPLYVNEPYFFDGLDELGGIRPVDPQKPDGKQYDPRARFLAAVQNQLSSDALLISCRVVDYQEIGEYIALPGAVTLLPLSSPKIELFLFQQSQEQLWQAIQTDESLLKLASNPLLLTLLSAAAGQEHAILQAELSTWNEARLFDFYIHKRFEHEQAKRGLPLPFDEEGTRHLLGKIAAAMWKEWYSPFRSISIQEIGIILGERTNAFVTFAKEMHFLHGGTSGTIEFLHLKLRDYCAVLTLIGALKNVDAGVRQRAASALGRIKDFRAVTGLLEALQDSDIDVRRTVANALGRIGESAVPGLLEALKDTDADVRTRATSALGRTQDARAVPGILAMLQDTDADVRRSATSALGRIGRMATPGLLEALKDTDAIVRRRAASALGPIKDPDAIAALFEALKDTDINVRRSAANALRHLNDPGTIPALFEALKDKDATVRRSATRALGQIQDPRTVSALFDALKDEDANVRQSAANALKQIKDPDSVPALFEALKDTERVAESL